MNEIVYSYCTFPNAIVGIKEKNTLSYHYIDKESFAKFEYFVKLFTCTTPDKRDGIDIFMMERDDVLDSNVFKNICDIFVYKRGDKKDKEIQTLEDLDMFTRCFFLSQKWMADKEITNLILYKIKDVFDYKFLGKVNIFTREWVDGINNFLTIAERVGGEYREDLYERVATGICKRLRVGMGRSIFTDYKVDTPTYIKDLDQVKYQVLKSELEFVAEFKFVQKYIIMGLFLQV